MDDLEKDFQKWLRKQTGLWHSSVEYALGGDDGFADEVYLNSLGVLVPVELKRGEVRGGLFVTKEIRPAQIRWHKLLHRAGGLSLFLFGAPVLKGWVAYWGHITTVEDWQLGLEIGKNVWPVDRQVEFGASFEALLLLSKEEVLSYGA